jgi:hypothetical protein
MRNQLDKKMQKKGKKAPLKACRIFLETILSQQQGSEKLFH